MRRHLFTEAFILASLFFCISRASYACNSLPIPVIDSPSGTYSYVSVGTNITLDGSSSYDPDGGDIETWQWKVEYYDRAWYLIDTIYGEVTGYVVSDPRKYRFRLYVWDDEGTRSLYWDTCYVYACDADIENTPPDRDTAEYLAYQTSMNVYYKIEPDSYWTPDDVYLIIKDDEESHIRTIFLPDDLGEQTAVWDGKDNRGYYVDPAEYTAEIQVLKGGETVCLDTHSVDVLNVQITELNGGNPNCDYQFAFNSASPGVCNVTASGTTGVAALDADLVWTLEDISGSIKTSDPNPAEGPNMTFTYTDLPSSNSEFGEKTLTLTHPASGFQDTNDLQIFFEPGADNHPVLTGEETMYQGTPNWFYYWKKDNVASGMGGFNYDDDPPSEVGDAAGYYEPSYDELYLCEAATDLGDDIDAVLTNISYQISINSGPDGIAKSIIGGDDSEEIPFYEGEPYAIAIIPADPNTPLESDPNAIWWGDDGEGGLVYHPNYGYCITTGENGECETHREGGDQWMEYIVGDVNIAMEFGHGQPYTTIITPGSNKYLESTNGFYDDEYDYSNAQTVEFHYIKRSGIYMVSIVCSHEMIHQDNYDMLRLPIPEDPPYHYDTINDGDSPERDHVHDDFELSSSYHLDPNRTLTYEIDDPNKLSGIDNDNEFLAYMGEGQGSGDPNKDWSVDGTKWQ